MSSDMVLAKLGEPLRVVHHFENAVRITHRKDGAVLRVDDRPEQDNLLQEIVWYYSAQGDSNANFELRAVGLDRTLSLRRTYKKHVSD